MLDTSTCGKKDEALAAIDRMASDCSGANWDGYGAEPIDPIAVSNAKAFVLALPDDVPMPEFAPEPDGAVSLDWVLNRHRMLSVSVSATDRVAYAWMNGNDKENGVAAFTDGTVPARLRQLVRGLVAVADRLSRESNCPGGMDPELQARLDRLAANHFAAHDGFRILSEFPNKYGITREQAEWFFDMNLPF